MRLLRGGPSYAYSPGMSRLAVLHSDTVSTFQQCIDKAVDHGGDPPTCTKVGPHQWVASWPGDSLMSPGGGPGSGFVILFVLMILAGIGITVWKVSASQKMARSAGLDPGLATGVTLLSDDGLAATYLASSLRQHPATTPPATTPDTAARLQELARLRAQGLVTDEEYAARRQAIIDSV